MARERLRFLGLAESIRAEILRGLLPPGTLLPTERALQESHNVSRTTVRRALLHLVETGWAENLPNRGVVAKIGRGSDRTHRIAFIDHHEWVHKSLFFNLHSQLAQRGFSLTHIDSGPQGTLAGMKQAIAEGYDAAFVWGKVAFVDHDELSSLLTKLPFLFVDHSLGGEPSELIMSDHLQGARLAVSHLIKLGRKRIAITGNFTHHEDAQLRFAGYVAAHYDNSAQQKAIDYIFTSPGHCDYEDTRMLMYRLQDDDRPDALFVLHDMSVPAVVEAVYRVGLRVPEDIAVVGFGNDLPFSLEGVGLTTVAMNWQQVANALTERVLHRLDHPSAPFRRTLVPTRLIIRGSCGAPPESWMDDGYEVSSVTVTRRMLPPSDRGVSQLSSSSALDYRGASGP